MDRTLATAFGVSLACHLVLLGFQVVDLHRRLPVERAKALEVVYEYEIAKQELQRLQQQFAQLREPPTLSERGGGSSVSPGFGGGGLSQVRIPDRPLMGVSAMPPGGAGANRASIIDLTNLVDAAQGDPVLLSYFSAIREQIQRTANHQTWMTGDPDAEGLVYVSFVLGTTGRVQAVSVVGDRSVSSRALQEIALRIIKASSPFTPFPPSMSGPSKTVVVPLEFLRGS